MPDLTIQQIFGNSIYAVNPYGELAINLVDYQDTSNNGNIENDLGLDDANYLLAPDGMPSQGKATIIFYAIMLLIMQNQAANKNEDPEQKIYIQPSGVSVVTSGSRQGQVERRFTVSFFSADGVNNLADIDDI